MLSQYGGGELRHIICPPALHPMCHKRVFNPHQEPHAEFFRLGVFFCLLAARSASIQLDAADLDQGYDMVYSMPHLHDFSEAQISVISFRHLLFYSPYWKDEE